MILLRQVVAVVQLVTNEDSFVSSISKAQRAKGSAQTHLQLPQLPLRTIKTEGSWAALGETLAGAKLLLICS